MTENELERLEELRGEMIIEHSKTRRKRTDRAEKAFTLELLALYPALIAAARYAERARRVEAAAREYLKAADKHKQIMCYAHNPMAEPGIAESASRLSAARGNLDAALAEPNQTQAKENDQ